METAKCGSWQARALSAPREICFGIDVDSAGEFVIARDVDGKACVTNHYRADASGLEALKREIESEPAHRRICVRACGAAAFALALQLVATPGAEVMFVAPQVAVAPGSSISISAADTPDQRAERLVAIARRML
jgi:hypothetical protein